MGIIDPAVFKAYDIRGRYGEELDAGSARAIGRAFTRVIADLAGKRPAELCLGLGRDMRLTAPEMAAAYRDGICDEGAIVLDAGMVCTASHNPKAYTGAKLVGRGAIALSGDTGIGDVRDRISAGLGEPSGGG